MKAYLLSYANTLGTRDEVKLAIHTMGGVKSWRFDMPNSFYILSEQSAGELTRLLRAARGNKGRFLIVEIGSNSSGWLPPDAWKFLKRKE